MPKRIALKISVLCCALLIATAVVAAPRQKRAEDGRRTTVNTLSIQRLLSERFRLSLDIFRSLRALEDAQKTEEDIGKLTIVDEPDPFAIGKEDQTEPGGEESDDSEERRRRQDEQNGANPNTQPYQTMN